jgi:hypothetical protein
MATTAREAAPAAEYHLIDRRSGRSRGGFATLEGARTWARWAGLGAWDIFHGNAAVERHEPDSDAA